MTEVAAASICFVPIHASVAPLCICLVPLYASVMCHSMHLFSATLCTALRFPVDLEGGGGRLHLPVLFIQKCKSGVVKRDVRETGHCMRLEVHVFWARLDMPAKKS